MDVHPPKDGINSYRSIAKWLYMDYIWVMDESPLIQWFAPTSPVPGCPAILVELAAKFVKVLEKQPFSWVDKP